MLVHSDLSHEEAERIRTLVAAVGAPDGTTGGVEGLIAGLGGNGFGKSLFDHLEKICRPDYCSVYYIGRQAVRNISTAGVGEPGIANRQVALYLQRWQRDPMVATARQQLSLRSNIIVHSAIADLPSGDFRDILYESVDICDRIIVCGHFKDGITSVSFLRRHGNGAFDEEDIAALEQNIPLIAAAITKQIELIDRSPDLSSMLGSLDHIRRYITAFGVPFSRREIEVCVRMLHGMSIRRIALDLGIESETATTYNKRALSRLGLAGQRDLLLWYIGQYQKSAPGRD